MVLLFDGQHVELAVHSLPDNADNAPRADVQREKDIAVLFSHSLAHRNASDWAAPPV